MPFLTVPIDYFEWERTDDLVALLGRNAEALPIRLWTYCGKNPQMQGKLTHEAMAGIERKLRWWGEKGDAIKALKDTLFIMYVGDAHLVVDWPVVGGHLLNYKRRATAAANSRWGMLKACSKHATSIPLSMEGGNGATGPPSTDPLSPPKVREGG